MTGAVAAASGGEGLDNKGDGVLADAFEVSRPTVWDKTHMEEAAEKVNEGIQAKLLDVRRDAVLPEAPLDPDKILSLEAIGNGGKVRFHTLTVLRVARRSIWKFELRV